MRKALFLVPATLEALERKGVASMIMERDEGGYFDHVFTIHYPAAEDRVVRLNERHTVIEDSPRDPRPDGGTAGKTPTRLLSRGATVRFLWWLRSLVRSEQISLIRATEPYHRGLWALLLSKATGVPWCVSLHADYGKRLELDPERGAPRILGSRTLAKRLERFVLSRAPLVLPIRESLGAYAVRNGADPRRIRVIPHGISMEPFLKPPYSQFTERFGVAGRRPISFVGRLSRENYVFDVLEVARRVIPHRPDVVFLLAGDGDERTALEAAAHRQGLAGHVKFLGFLPRDRVAELRVNSEVALCFMGGLSLIEAAAAGRPLIAYDVEWHGELVRNGETGFLVPEGDVEGAAAALLRLLEDRGLADRMGKAARELALQRHSPEAARRSRIQAYEELLGMRRVARTAPPEGEGGAGTGPSPRGRPGGPGDRIRQGDPWYTDDQHEAAGSPHQARIVRGRIDFLVQIVSDLKAALAPRGALRALDAGCGDGVFLAVLAGIPEVEVWGVDYNPLRVQRARARVPSATVQQGDLTALAFPDGSFDLVLLNQVLEHVPDARGVLRELVRVLRPGGCLVLGVPNEGCLLARLRNRVLQPSIARTTDHVNFYTEPAICRLVEEAGCVVRSVRREGFFTPYLPVHSWLTARAWGHRALELLGAVFPSQAGALYLVCVGKMR